MRRLLAVSGAALICLFGAGSTPVAAAGPPQGTQSDSAFAGSFTTAKVFNTLATTQKTSCFTPEVPFFTNNGPAEGYTGMWSCGGAANTGENLGPYPTQSGSNPGFPASAPMLVKNHPESNMVADPLNPLHLIGSSKWFVSAEGYNHELGFYESFDGGPEPRSAGRGGGGLGAPARIDDGDPMDEQRRDRHHRQLPGQRPGAG